MLVCMYIMNYRKSQVVCKLHSDAMKVNYTASIQMYNSFKRMHTESSCEGLLYGQYQQPHMISS